MLRRVTCDASQTKSKKSRRCNGDRLRNLVSSTSPSSSNQQELSTFKTMSSSPNLLSQPPSASSSHPSKLAEGKKKKNPQPSSFEVLLPSPSSLPSLPSSLSLPLLLSRSSTARPSKKQVLIQDGSRTSLEGRRVFFDVDKSEHLQLVQVLSSVVSRMGSQVVSRLSLCDWVVTSKRLGAAYLYVSLVPFETLAFYRNRAPFQTAVAEASLFSTAFLLIRSSVRRRRATAVAAENSPRSASTIMLLSSKESELERKKGLSLNVSERSLDCRTSSIVK